MNTVRYKAFISYSHRDASWSAWLQRSLERYRVPKRLAGTRGEFGPVPERLSPVFRDREDLPTATDLSGKVKEALKASEALLVVCSPASAQSRWVNEEIDYFRSLGRGDRIFALIVDGDPQAESAADRCFPPALTTGSDGKSHEPLAADVRKWADGKLLSRQKIISGLLGIRLDELRRRDQQQRRKNWAAAAVTALAILVVTLTLAISAITSKKAVQLQRASTEELLSYMLGNLKRLDPIVGLEVVDRNDSQVQEFIAALEFYKLSNEQMVEWGLAWREQGISEHERGALDAAMRHFQQSRAAFIELHQREGSTRQTLYELGQAEFWVGYVQYDRGDLDEAELSWTRYGAITRRLVNADPNDAEMVMELSYSLTNLGAIERARRNPDLEQAMRLSQSALQYNQIALVLDPENETYTKDLENKLAFLADAWMESCDLGKAYDFRQQNVALARDNHQKHPEDIELKLNLAYALFGMAKVQRRMPLPEQALDALEESYELMDQVADQDPDNLIIRWRALTCKQRMLRIRMGLEPFEKLWPEAIDLKQQLEDLHVHGGLDNYDASADFAYFLAEYSQLAFQTGREYEAEAWLDDSIMRLTGLVGENPDHRRSRYSLAHAIFMYWERNGALPSEGAGVFVKSYLDSSRQATSCDDASLAAALELMRGNISGAKDYTNYILGRGLYEHSFVAFCRRHNLCD